MQERNIYLNITLNQKYVDAYTNKKLKEKNDIK
jgi:hypothetical protein